MEPLNVVRMMELFEQTIDTLEKISTDLETIEKRTAPTVVNISSDYSVDPVEFARELRRRFDLDEEKEPEPLADWERELLDQSEPVEDVIREPSHYKREGLECIDFTADMPGAWSNLFKYVWRYGDKAEGTEDIDKAREYLRIIERKGVSNEKAPDNRRYCTLYDRYLGSPWGSIAEQRWLALTKIYRGAHLDVVEAELDVLQERVEADR